MYGALVLFESEFVHVVAISFTALILTELLMVALTIRTWHWLMVVAEFFSLGCYLASLAFLNEYFGTYLTSLFKGYRNQILETLMVLSLFNYYFFLSAELQKKKSHYFLGAQEPVDENRPTFCHLIREALLQIVRILKTNASK